MRTILKNMTKHAIINVALSETNNMKKHYNRWLFHLVRTMKRVPLMIFAVLLILGFVSFGVVHASIQSQIEDLSNSNANTQNALGDLQLKAKNYQDVIRKLKAEIYSIQGAINASEKKQAQLQQQINENQVQLDQQKKMLGDDLKSMYVNGQMSTVEMLATSNSLSDFVDSQTYATAVQNKIQDTMDQITTLQNQLRAEQEQVKQLLAQQQAQQDRLASDKAQQDQLLHLNQGQQNAYNKKIAENQRKITVLEAQQAAINAADSTQVDIPPGSGGSGGVCDVGYGNGGYPMKWCNAPQDSIPTIPYSSDPINRECTSFAYWYFTVVEGKPLYVLGDAKNWAYTANRPVDQTPSVGAIGVKTAGPFGHVVIVVAGPGGYYHGVSVPSGYVLTMSMNYDYNGHFHYSQYPIKSLLYIH